VQIMVSRKRGGDDFPASRRRKETDRNHGDKKGGIKRRRKAVSLVGRDRRNEPENAER